LPPAAFSNWHRLAGVNSKLRSFELRLTCATHKKDNEYKRSLNRLLESFEISLMRAEVELEHPKLSGNPTLVKDAESNLEAARAQVQETERRIADADKQISRELFNSQSAPIAPDKDLLPFTINPNTIESEYNADDQSLGHEQY
jgi:hypothetical protein